MDIKDYFDNLPEDRKGPMLALRKVIADNLPKGFEEQLCYNMPSFVVPLSTYPAGYNCNPKLPLQFIGIASQKNFIVLHHIGVYFDKDLVDWFTAEYPKYSKTKLDMGKGCIRFKKPDQIPFELIAELAAKITPQDYIAVYEQNVKNR